MQGNVWLMNTTIVLPERQVYIKWHVFATLVNDMSFNLSNIKKNDIECNKQIGGDSGQK